MLRKLRSFFHKDIVGSSILLSLAMIALLWPRPSWDELTEGDIMNVILYVVTQFVIIIFSGAALHFFLKPINEINNKKLSDEIINGVELSNKELIKEIRKDQEENSKAIVEAIKSMQEENNKTREMQEENNKAIVEAIKSMQEENNKAIVEAIKSMQEEIEKTREMLEKWR